MNRSLTKMVSRECSWCQLFVKTKTSPLGEGGGGGGRNVRIQRHSLIIVFTTVLTKTN